MTFVALQVFLVVVFAEMSPRYVVVEGPRLCLPVVIFRNPPGDGSGPSIGRSMYLSILSLDVDDPYCNLVTVLPSF